MLHLLAILALPWMGPPDPWSAVPERHPVPAAASAPMTFVVTREDGAVPLDYLWVPRTALLDRSSIAQVVERAREMHVRGLLVQVVGRGDAWYRSDILPRPEALGDPTLDPLGEILPAAHAAGLEVHAWMNCALVWSAPNPPRDPRHVVHAHPEWVVRMPGGRSMARMGTWERERLRVEGVYLSPAPVGVRAWLASIAREIVERYPVDGVQLDYIREPGVPLTSDPASRTAFALRTGVDAERIARLPEPRRAGMDSAWRAFQEEQVTAIVRAVRDTLQRTRPGVSLSAAVLADTAIAQNRHAQTWQAWLREGLLDRAFVMCYAPPVQTVLDQVTGYDTALAAEGRVVPGIAVYNSPAADAAAKLKGAMARGFRSFALYSYDTLFAQRGYWPALREMIATADDAGGGRGGR